MGIYFHTGPIWKQKEGSSTRDFERWMMRALGIGHFSLKRLTVEGLWEGFLYWGPGRRVKKGSTYGHLSPQGLIYALGKPGIRKGGSYTGDLE
jgi:hypothetical protein